MDINLYFNIVLIFKFKILYFEYSKMNFIKEIYLIFKYFTKKIAFRHCTSYVIINNILLFLEDINCLLMNDCVK